MVSAEIWFVEHRVMSTRLWVSHSSEFRCTLALKTETQKAHSAALLHHLRLFCLFSLCMSAKFFFILFRTCGGKFFFSFVSDFLFFSQCNMAGDTFLGGFQTIPPRAALVNPTIHTWTHQIYWQAQAIGQRREDLRALVDSIAELNFSHFAIFAGNFQKKKSSPWGLLFTHWNTSSSFAIERYSLSGLIRSAKNIEDNSSELDLFFWSGLRTFRRLTFCRLT